MKFKEVHIKNFRNYGSTKIELGNKNIVFGRNDFGKTNFLAALRFLFEPSIRRAGFQVSDYHQKNTSEDILIRVAIELDESMDSEFLRARMGGATSFASETNPTIYIQVEGEFDKDKQFGNPVLTWGGSLDELQAIPQRGFSSALDSIFDLTYINPNVSPEELYKKHQSILHKKEDSDKHEIIEGALKDLNRAISSDSRVKKISEELSERYNSIRNESIAITLQSEHQVNGVFNNLVPYIHSHIKESDLEQPGVQDEHLYPTSGDGRRKILAYALTSYIEELKIEEKKDRRISIFLVEEVENSLHPTMQEAVSRHLFDHEKDIYPYLFITTHSEHMFIYADDVELIRIYKESNQIYSKSAFYKVPNDYKKTRKNYNALLSKALFYDRVLLVEGMSEKILFDAVLEELVKEKKQQLNYLQLERTNILSIEGIGFTDYVKLLVRLGITTIIKTDNDIRKIAGQKVSMLGINRCQHLECIIECMQELPSKYLESSYSFDGNWSKSDTDLKNRIKREIYGTYENMIVNWKVKGIFLSEVELEEDFIEVLTSKEPNFEEKYGMSPSELIIHLQDSKKKHMNSFVNHYMDIETAEAIYNHDNFKCLKYLVGDYDETK